ncbi:MAG: sulfatase, partial [Prolixibacteraceae bacterium]|nr:sulfatase [Prolixibacteraceae bacterium]
ASSCSPSRNSILSGRYPHNTGAAELHTEPPMDMLSFPEVLNNSGYYCGFSGKFHSHNFARKGFDTLSVDYEEIGNSGSDDWLNIIKSRPENQPFFMWFAALDAHRDWGKNKYSGTHHPDSVTVPFYLVDAPGTRKDLAQYYDEIYRFDQRINEVLAELEAHNILDNTLVFVLADNGRPFPHSKTRVNDRGMKSPFIVYWPAHIKNTGIECNSLLSAIDIAPTILDIARCAIDSSFQGKSFAHLFQKPHQKFRNYVFAEHNWHDFEALERMVRNDSFMYILNERPHFPNQGPADAVSSPSYADLDSLKKLDKLEGFMGDIFIAPRPAEELYNLLTDSLQLHNLAQKQEYSNTLIKMRKVMQTWRKQTGDNTPENLTKDWFLRNVPGYKQTEYNETRGEMPGKANKATEINNKGPF